MSISNSFHSLVEKTLNGFKRFPITISWAILGTLFTIWFIDANIEYPEELKYIRFILTAVLGVSWLIGTRLLGHFFKEEIGQNKYWISIIPLIFLVIYFYFLPTEKHAFDDYKVPYRFALYLFTGHLFIFFSPFILKWDKSKYWNYLRLIFHSFIQSAIFSLIIYLGILIAMFALKYLFHVDFNDKLPFQLFVFCLGIVNTWLFLSDLPERIHDYDVIEYPRTLEIFVKYILIPLTILYLVILYTYAIKIIAVWELPKGWVSYLIIALSVLGFLIHILVNPIRKTTNSVLIKSFYPWFYYALIPMISLLFVAIWRRISEYGFTENRYLVLLMACWILGMTLYIIFSKQKKLMHLPQSVAIITLLASFGYWGMFYVSKQSQLDQFEKLYQQFKTDDFTVTRPEVNRFESISRYLNDRNMMSKTTDVLGFNPTEIFDTEKYNYVYKMIEKLDFKIIETSDDYNKDNISFNVQPEQAFDIKGYDHFKFIHLSNYEYSSKRKNMPIGFNEIEGYYFELDSIRNSTINVVLKDRIVHVIELEEMVKDLKSNYSHKIRSYNHHVNEIPQDKFIITREFEEVDIKIFLQHLNLTKKDNSALNADKIDNLSGAVLIRLKDRDTSK